MILNSRQFQEDICFDSCKEATTCGAVFLKVAITLNDVGDVTKPSTSLAPVILWQRMLPSQAPWLQILKRPATGCAMMGKADISFIQAYCKGGFSLSRREAEKHIFSTNLSRRIAEEDFDVTNINSWSPSLAHYTHVYNNMNNNNENQEESSSNSRSMVKLLHRRRIWMYLKREDLHFDDLLN